MVIENRDLAVGTNLVAMYKGEQWKIEVLSGELRTLRKAKPAACATHALSTS